MEVQRYDESEEDPQEVIFCHAVILMLLSGANNARLL